MPRSLLPAYLLHLQAYVQALNRELSRQEHPDAWTNNVKACGLQNPTLSSSLVLRPHSASRHGTCLLVLVGALMLLRPMYLSNICISIFMNLQGRDFVSVLCCRNLKTGYMLPFWSMLLEVIQSSHSQLLTCRLLRFPSIL